MENKFINSLREASNRLEKEIKFVGIDEKTRKIAEDIFLKKDEKCLRGK